MAENKRKSPRHELRVDVQLSFLAHEPTPAKTRDISEGGMFLEVEDSSEYKVGEILHLRYSDPFHNNTDTVIDALVVRITSDGIGITFPESVNAIRFG
jgi:c-di-GMP-binding flagellar brake protein YcgR